jgi:hypothetical protein
MLSYKGTSLLLRIFLHITVTKEPDKKAKAIKKNIKFVLKYTFLQFISSTYPFFSFILIDRNFEGHMSEHILGFLNVSTDAWYVSSGKSVNKPSTSRQHIR